MLKLILTIIQVLSGIAVTVVVLMQSGKSAGLSYFRRCRYLPGYRQSKDLGCYLGQMDQVDRFIVRHFDVDSESD